MLNAFLLAKRPARPGRLPHPPTRSWLRPLALLLLLALPGWAQAQAPVVSSISPASGQPGDNVTLIGNNLTGATAVTFSGLNNNVVTTNLFVFNSGGNQFLGLTVPLGAVTGNVTVTTPSGTSAGQLFTVRGTTWTGAVSTAWAVPGNWSPAQVPTASATATIPAGPANQPRVSTTTAVCDNLIVRAGASITLAAGANLTTTRTVLLLGGSTLTQAAGAELYIGRDLTNDGATFALDPTSEVGFGISPFSDHRINGTTGLTLPILTVGERLNPGTTDRLYLDVPVAVARKLELANDAVVNANGNLTLLSTPTATALVAQCDNCEVNNSVTVQRYIDGSLNAGLGYRHFAAPTANASFADLATATNGFTPVLTPGYNASPTPGLTVPFPNVFDYDQTRLATSTSNYSAFDRGFFVPGSSADPMLTGRGYVVNIAAGQKLTFEGFLYSGDLPVSLDRNTGPSAADAGWGLVGNPYPAPLDYRLVTAGDRPGLDAAMYVVQSTGQYAGGYRSYVNGVGNSLIASSQGFWVRVSQGQTQGSLTFKNAHRVTDENAQQAFQRGTPDLRPQLALALAGAGRADTWTAYAQAGATAAFDAQFDAAKLPNTHGLNLSSAAAGSAAAQLAIDGQPAFAVGTVLPLAVGLPAAGTYTLALTTLAHLPAGLAAYLADAQTGTLTALTAGASYAFSVTAAQAQSLVQGRFAVVFRAGTALAAAPALTAATVGIYPNPASGAFVVRVPAVAGAAGVQAELLDALGRVVARQEAALPAGGAQLRFAVPSVPAGVYVLRLNAGTQTLARRVVLD